MQSDIDSNDFLVGVPYHDKELIILFGYRYASIYLVNKLKRNTFGMFKFRVPSLEQCVYELNPQRRKLRNFLGFRKLKGK